MLGPRSRDNAALLLHLFGRSDLDGRGDASKGSGQVFSKARETIHSLSLLTVLAGIGVLGAILIWLSHYLPWQLAQELTKEFGAAALIAAILGITVDRGLKTELAKDVFFAAFRYVLPDELKSEVLRIINYRLMTRDHFVIIEIVPINDELVRVNISVDRSIENVARGSQNIFNKLAVDEWGFPDHKSSVDECFMEIGGKRFKGAPDPSYSGGDAVGWITESQPLTSNQTARLVSRGSEVHRANSALHLYFINPADRPTLEVRAPSGFKHSAGFGVPDETILESRISSHYRLDGAQFPGQAMRVRWWRDASVAGQISAPPSSEARPPS